MSVERKLSRLELYKAFDLFSDNASRWFTEFAKQDARHEFHSNEYSFYILRGGSAGGADSRILEVCYGNRPFDATVELRYSAHARDGKIPGSRRHVLTERGPALIYSRLDNGGVSCVLYPAGSDGFRRLEDSILLRIYQDARDLTGPAALRQDWLCFASYREFSSLDGQPTFLDWCRVQWLLFTRRTTVGGVLKERRVFVLGGRIVEYALTVALSGAVFVKLLEVFGVLPSGAAS